MTTIYTLNTGNGKSVQLVGADHLDMMALWGQGYQGDISQFINWLMSEHQMQRVRETLVYDLRIHHELRPAQQSLTAPAAITTDVDSLDIYADAEAEAAEAVIYRTVVQTLRDSGISIQPDEPRSVLPSKAKSLKQIVIQAAALALEDEHFVFEGIQAHEFVDDIIMSWER